MKTRLLFFSLLAGLLSFAQKGEIEIMKIARSTDSSGLYFDYVDLVDIENAHGMTSGWDLPYEDDNQLDSTMENLIQVYSANESILYNTPPYDGQKIALDMTDTANCYRDLEQRFDTIKLVANFIGTIDSVKWTETIGIAIVEVFENENFETPSVIQMGVGIGSDWRADTIIDIPTNSMFFYNFYSYNGIYDSNGNAIEYKIWFYLAWDYNSVSLIEHEQIDQTVSVYTFDGRLIYTGLESKIPYVKLNRELHVIQYLETSEFKKILPQ